MKETSNLVVNKEWMIDEDKWTLSLWKHPASSGRYIIEASCLGYPSLTFSIVRTTIGQWLVHGDNIPEQLQEQAAAMVEIMGSE